MPFMKNILFAMAIGALLYGCSYIQTYQKQEEIKQAFNSVNNSLARQAISAGADRKMDSLIIQLENNPDKSLKAIAILHVLYQVKSKSDILIVFINGLQTKLEANATGDADLDVTTKQLAEGPDGKLLKKMLTEYKSDMDTLMKPYPLPSAIPIDVSPPGSEAGEELPWEKAFFHMVPKVAAMTILNKFKNDVINTEVMCIERLSKEK
jgi:hypothetical protein